MDEEELLAGIRDAFVEAAARAYEEAGLAGLCAEGRWEAALGALRAVSVAPLLETYLRTREDEAKAGE